MNCIVCEPLSVTSGSDSVKIMPAVFFNYIHTKNGRHLVFLLLLFFILKAIRYVIKVCVTEVRFCLLLIKVNRFEIVCLQQYHFLSMNALKAAVAFENQIYCRVGL